MQPICLPWVAILAVGLCGACNSEDKTGTLGNSCYPNGTCNTGLYCAQGTCLQQQMADGGALADGTRSRDSTTAADTSIVDGGAALDTLPASACVTSLVVPNAGVDCSGGQIAVFGSTSCGTDIVGTIPAPSNVGWQRTCASGSVGGSKLCGTPVGDLRWRTSTEASFCPPSMKVLSGGCDCMSGTVITRSSPTAGDAGWLCQCTGGTKGTAYALCVDANCAATIGLSYRKGTDTLGLPKAVCPSGSRAVAAGCDSSPTGANAIVREAGTIGTCQVLSKQTIDAYAVCTTLPIN